MTSTDNSIDEPITPILAQGVDEEPVESNRRQFRGFLMWLASVSAGVYAFMHVAALNGLSLSGMSMGLLDFAFLPSMPLETWNFRIAHVAGALALGFLIFSGARFTEQTNRLSLAWSLLSAVFVGAALFGLYTAIGIASDIAAGALWNGLSPAIKYRETWLLGVPLVVASLGASMVSWVHTTQRHQATLADAALIIACGAVAVYLIAVYGTLMRNATGTPFAPIGISLTAVAGTILIMELTRRVAGLALVAIAGIFVLYVFVGDQLPGVLNSPPITWQRFFSQVYTDVGILGPTTAVSSTYIILFIIFAAFLQASKVGDYFVNFAFALAGRSRGGPAKVGIFASGLMGMINGTSAGNVVATGSLTIPLMKKVGYSKTNAGAIEAAASTGGQIMPPIMGAGAFIMAEVTGIPYVDIAIAAIIPSILYFGSIYFMVDLEAAKLGMRGLRDDELPKIKVLIKQAYLFLPIIILIAALFMGYSVIRAGTLAIAAAAVVSWLTPYPMNLPRIAKAFELGGLMSIQIIAVCACAGIIVGVISLTGVGARFSSLLLDLAASSQLMAMFFAMCISILLGMGMPTTAAYAVAASVVAPGLVNLGVPLLTAHFFVFYFAVVSAITPPVALASYAAAGISGANPMKTSIASFKIGLAAFIVPFMFFYNSALLMDGTTAEVIRAVVTALVGVYLLSGCVIGWFLKATVGPLLRVVLLFAALSMIEGGLVSDLAGVSLVLLVFFGQKIEQRKLKAT